MLEFFTKLFDTTDFPARWNCGEWEAAHGWLHILSDIAIFGAYFAIPAALVTYVRVKRAELLFPRIFWLFGAFIFCCGTTHLLEAVIFYEPIYRFAGVVKLLTAVVSWTTVFALLRVAPTALELPGLKRVNEMLTRQIDLHTMTSRELEESNRELNEFTGVVSHDLRSPICSALFMAELARESVERDDRVNLPLQIDQIVDTLHRMEALVSDLHRRALNSGRSKPFVNVDLKGPLQAALANLVKPIADARAVVKISSLPVVSGDADLLARLFTNLIQYFLREPVHADPVVRVASSQGAGGASVTLTDSGRHLPPEKLERLFADGEEHGGNVGLSVCRRIMELHGGSITASADEAGGTRFTLTFPRNS